MSQNTLWGVICIMFKLYLLQELVDYDLSDLKKVVSLRYLSRLCLWSVAMCFGTDHVVQANNTPVTEGAAEIGEPFFSIKPFKVVFAPNGSTFYVLNPLWKSNLGSGTIVHYQLNPFKKLESFDMPTLPTPFGKYTADSIFVTADEKRLIFFNLKSVMLFDLGSKRIIKKVEFDDFAYGATLECGRLLVFFRTEIGSRIKALNVEDLTTLKEVSNSDKDMYPGYAREKKMGVFNISGNIIESSTTEAWKPSLIIYNPETLKPSFIVRTDNRTGHVRASFDFTKLYIPRGFSIQSSYYSKPFRETGNKTIEIDLENKKAKFLKSDQDSYFSSSLNLHVYGGFNYFSLSQTNGFVWIERRLFNIKRKQFFTFYLLDNGESVLQNDMTKQIIVTTNAVKQLKMKNRQGKIGPMNDATFNKYRTTLESL